MTMTNFSSASLTSKQRTHYYRDRYPSYAVMNNKGMFLGFIHSEYYIRNQNQFSCHVLNMISKHHPKIIIHNMNTWWDVWSGELFTPFWNVNTRQLPMGAGYCQWGGYTDRIVCNIHGKEHLASRYRAMLRPGTFYTFGTLPTTKATYQKWESF